MKKLLMLATLVSLNAAAQDYGDFLQLRETKYLNAGLSFDGPTKYTFYFTIPGTFPSKPKDVSFKVDCAAGKVIAGQPALTAGKAYGLKFSNLTAAVSNFSVGCEKGSVFAKGPSLEFVLNAFDPGGELRREVQTATNIDIFDRDGYRFPNIKQDYFRYAVKVSFDDSTLYAESTLDNRAYENRDIVVGVKQGKVSPVLFNGETAQVDLNTGQPFSVFYNLGSGTRRPGWYALDVTPAAGKIAWRKLSGPLK